MTEGTAAWWIVAVWAGVTSVVWVVAYLRASWTLTRMPRLSDAVPGEPSPWPKLSIVIPACNEADTIEAAIATLLAQDHPNLELVVVDDRSTDGTGEIVDRVAAADARVTAVHVETLPDGWLGKVHALHVGASRATGSWILFTDADVHYAPGALRRAHALAVDRGMDMLVLIPQLRTSGVVHESAVTAFGGLFFQTTKPDEVADPDSDAYVGGGAFNLVRRSVFDRSEGFEYLRMEVADDVGLGLVMKRAGARQECWLATGEVSVLWYPSIAAMARGLEKNMFGIIGHYRLWRLSCRLLAFTALVVGPFAGLLHSPALALVSALAFGVIPVSAAVVRTRMPGHRFLPALLTPVGQVLIIYMIARSTWVCLRNGAIEWRGTRYPLDRLAELQRVKV